MSTRAITARSGLALAIMLACSLASSAPGSSAPTAEKITITSVDPKVGPIPATVNRPDGEGPFPAIVLLHGCSGVGESDVEWGVWLRRRGYVTIMPESLSPRHLETSCGRGLGYGLQAQDGLGALAYLRGQSYVAPAKVFVMGWSHGGAATLISAGKGFMKRFSPSGGPYRAAIALYPACEAFPKGDLASPLMMLMGAEDDWQPPGQCVQRGTELQATGAPIEWTVYPGTTHAFDVPKQDRSFFVNGRLVHLRYDPAAAGDAHTRVEQYLRAHLQ